MIAQVFRTVILQETDTIIAGMIDIENTDLLQIDTIEKIEGQHIMRIAELPDTIRSILADTVTPSINTAIRIDTDTHTTTTIHGDSGSWNAPHI